MATREVGPQAHLVRLIYSNKPMILATFPSLQALEAGPVTYAGTLPMFRSTFQVPDGECRPRIDVQRMALRLHGIGEVDVARIEGLERVDRMGIGVDRASMVSALGE